MSTLSGIGGASSWSSTQVSGTVDKTELQGMLDAMATRSGKTGKLSADELLAKADANGDGSLDKAELEQGMESLMPAPASTMAFAQSRVGPGGPGGPGGPPPPADDGEFDTFRQHPECGGLMARAGITALAVPALGARLQRIWGLPGRLQCA